ncbi:hypothetical protein IG631_03737 [Alternaria alternata]|nr:hypothetical protein IG631_03737 [Alternaria alternata]
MALTPLTGSTPADMYMDLLAKVSSRRRISVRLLSNSLVEATGVLQPTPLCHIAYVTLFLPAVTLGRVNSEKKRRSISVSIISSASGLAFSNSGSFSVGVCSGSASSKMTSLRTSWPRRLRFRRAAQKKWSSHVSRWSASYRKGSSRVRTLMQLRASRSGASSGSGKEGWLRRTMRREVTARMSVSRLARLLSRVRRMSAGEKSEKTSSVDSGSSQNWRHSQHSNSIESNEQSIRQSNKRHRQGFAWVQTGERRLA